MAAKKPCPQPPAARWYVVTTSPGDEGKLRKYLLRQARSLGLGEQLGQVLIPTEPFFQRTWQGKRLSRRRACPGYLFLSLAPRARSTVRALLARAPVEARFLGRRPLSPQEMAHILQIHANRRPPPVSYQKGERVRVLDGLFAHALGLVEALSPEKNQLHIQIELFNRKLLIQVDPDQVEKAD